MGLKPTEMVTQCGESWVTPSVVDTPLPLQAHHNFFHLAATVLVHDGYLWLEDPILIMASHQRKQSRSHNRKEQQFGPH